jgi:autotransporter-associated beta strand protein
MKLKQNPFLRHSLALAAGTAFLAMGSAHAATYDWTGATNSNFTEASNWSQNAWTQWDDYRFGGTPTNATVTINGYFGIGSLTLQSGLTTDIVINSSNAQPIIMNTAYSNSGQAAISIAADSSNLTINGEYVAGSAVTWDVGAGRTLTMNGPLNNWANQPNVASLVKNGAGTATLTQKSNYSGGTTVNGGILSLADGDWMTGGFYSGGGGANGAIIVGSGATLSLSAGVTGIQNGLTLNGGTVSSRGLTYSNYRNLLLESNITAGGAATSTISSEIALFGDRTISVGSGSTLNITGGIANNGFAGGSQGITKTGDGILSLYGSNTYGGGTAVSGGKLILQNTYGSSGFAISTGATVELNVASGSRDLAGTTFSSSGTLTKTGAGSVVWGVGSATFALGAGSLIDVQEGTFGGGSNANENWSGNLSGLNVASGATFNGVEANVRVNALTGAGTITSGYGGAGYQNFTFGVNNGSGIFSGSLTDSDSAAANFVKAGSGTQTLTGTLNYDGTTTVSGGTLILPDGDWRTGGLYSGGNGASGTIIVGTGATLSTSSGVTGLQNGLVLNGGTVSSRGLAYSNYRNLLLESNITAGGAATSTISSEISLRGYRSIDVGADSTLNVTGGIANDGFDGGSQGITKTGDGTLNLSGTNNSYTGGTVVNDGTLVINGNISTSSMTTVQTGAALGGSGTVGSLTIDSGAFLNPGNSPGILNVDGDYNQAGTLAIEITGLIAGTQHDQVNVDLTTGDFDGSVTLSGSLVTAFSGGSYANGNLLFILLNDESDAISGTFSGLAQNAIVANYGGFDWKISYTANSAGNTFTGGNDVALMAVPEPNVAALLGGLGMLCLLRRRR